MTLDESLFDNAASGGSAYIGVAVSYDPGGTPITDPVSAPTATGAGTLGSLEAGTYAYKVTFVGGDPLGESLPSPSTTPYVASGSTSKVALTVIPTGGTGTTARNIYQSTDGTNFFFLHQIANNSGTTYTDDGSDTPTSVVAPRHNTTNIGKRGLAPAPTQFVPITDNTLHADFDMAEPKTMRGTDLSSAVMVPTKIDPMGDVTWLNNPALGPVFIQNALSGHTALSPVTATTTTDVVTANGISSMTIDGAFLQGAMVDVNTAAAMERRTVAGYDTGTKVLQLYELDINAAALAGLSVTQVAQTMYSKSQLDAPLRKRVPLLCVEDASGAGDWSWVYRDLAVDGLDFSFAEKECSVKTTFVGSAEPLYYSASGNLPDGETAADGTTSSYDPDPAVEAVALNPFTAKDCYLTAGGDPDATGTSAFRAALGAENVKITYKNGYEKTAPFNASNAYLYLQSGNASCDITYDEIVTSLRPDVWYDYEKASKAVSFIMGAWKNFGTASSPSYKGVSVLIPNMKYSKTPQTKKIGSADRWARAGKALAPPGGTADYLVVFVAS